jgi:hypothetical protein
MENIKKLVDAQFTLFNVSTDKRPINGRGIHMSGWETITAQEAQLQHNYDLLLWGIRCGKHCNNRIIMSLDFDCCGQKNKITGEREGCKYTQDKLAEYLAFDITDGLFSSSTRGNMNVLIDYTNCPTLIELVQSRQLSKFKRSGTDLEILLGSGHQQVIPPSQTNCKITKTLGNARRFLGDKPMLVLYEDMPVFPFIMELLKEPARTVKNTKKKETTVCNSSSNDNAVKHDTFSPISIADNAVINTDDKYLDLLFNVIKNEHDETGVKVIDWDTWFQIAGILKSNNYDVELFIEYSKSNSTRNESMSLWNGIKKNSMSIYGLKNIAKRINPIGYTEWARKHEQFISASVLQQGENDVSKHIAPQLKDKLKYSNGIWYYFDERTRLWDETKDAPYSLVITHLQNEIAFSRSICESVFAQDIEKTRTEEERVTLESKRKRNIEVYDKAYKDVTGSKFSSQLLKILKDDVKEKDFNERLDNNIYEIAYKNGILDLVTLKFRAGLKATDYLTKTIPFNYEVPSDDDVAAVREELKKICNYNETHLNYYLSILGYSLTGDASRKQEFYYLRGQKASNGKSVVFENLSEIIPNYVGKIQNDVYDKRNTTRHKSIQEWSGLRIAWTNELTTDKKDREFIKDVSDGMSIKYKKMYGTEQSMKITFKNFMIGNHTFDIDADGGIKRRTRILQMDSDFIPNLEADDYSKCHFKKDETFGLLLRTTYKHALLHLIFTYSKRFVDNNYELCEYPSDWAEETEETMNSSNKFCEWFEDHFDIFTGSEGQIENDFKINKATLENALKGFYGKVNFKDEVKKNRWSFTYDSQKKLENVKGVWNGFRLLNDAKLG